MNTNNGKRIIVHKKGEEGAFHVDAMTGLVLTPPEERPMWSEGLATAMLAERVGYYERALGTNIPEGLRAPDAIAYEDLSWIGVDQEGDEVEIEANAEFRSEVLAELLSIDTSVEGWETLMENAVASASVDYTYMTHPTDEETLAEAEPHTFSEAEKKSAEG